MRRGKNILLTVCIVAVAALALLGVQAAREFVVPIRFDDEFYG